MPSITPVILCGGSGSRLWPLSRKSYPKQFSNLIGDKSLFQESAKRFSNESSELQFAPPLILTNSDFRFIVTEQLAEVGIDPSAILIEPESRNTAPAILAAALHLIEADENVILLVAPSDHVVPDKGEFHAAIQRGLTAIEQNILVTFGITPTRAETGYGYMELSDIPDEAGDPIKPSRFVEKPDADKAEEMFRAGNFLWNSGIFLFKASDIIAAFERNCPTLIEPVGNAVKDAKPDLGFLRLAPEPWANADNISIDYAVMERADNISVVPYNETWLDLGGWEAIWREGDRDENGVVSSPSATAIDCENTLLRSESDTLELVGLGLSNIIAVAMPDAVLIADMSRAQDVKTAVVTLKSKKVTQAETFPKDHRPWGWFESLVVGPRFQVKRIVVNPGAALSLQSHVHRSEHWIVVAGTAKVTIDDEVKFVTENQSVFIPQCAKHRMENPGKMPMVLIEVQTGSYLGEDDIVRFEDVYARE